MNVIIIASAKSTSYEGKFSQDCMYTEVLLTNTHNMEANYGRSQEDMRGQWTTYKKMYLWFQTTKADFLKT